MRIGIDMDGVLCDFNRSLIDFIRENLNNGIPDQSESFPAEWNYFRAYVKPSEESFMWEQVESSAREFWRNLYPVHGSLRPLFRLSHSVHDLYFITTRGGKTAKRQSETWLTERARIPFPTVLIADDPEAKGSLCRALKLDYFVDDRPENCQWAVKHSPGTRVYLVDRPYNRDLDVDGASRVSSFEEFAVAVEEGKRKE